MHALPQFEVDMNSKTIYPCELPVAACGDVENSLKERPVHFSFEKLRRTRSMPKRSQNEKPKVSPATPEPSSPIADYFKGFNRAKSRFFHSCRMPKSEKTEKTSRNPISSAFCKHNRYQQFSSRPSVISETDTVASSLSLNEDEEDEKAIDSTTTFKSSIMPELEADSPSPTPPPRTYSTNPDASELPQLRESPSPVDIASLAASVYSEDGSFLNYFDDEMDHDCEDVRIYPVLQNGVKMSDTHYWVINPPKNRPRRCQETKVTLRGNSEFNSSGRPTGFSAKLLDVGQSHYENLPDASASSSPGSELPCEGFQSTRLCRGKSECNKEVLRLIQRTLVEKLQLEVPMARTEECRAVLIGSSWNFQKAQRRLKVELLCRLGCASKSACERLLEDLNWNFDEAYDFIRNSTYYNLRHVRDTSITRDSLSSRASSACNSTDVTPDTSPDIPFLHQPLSPHLP